MQPLRKQEADDVKIFVVGGGEAARELFRFGKRPDAGQRRIHGELNGGHGIMAVFNGPLPSIRRNSTSDRFSSGSSACTKSLAVTPPEAMMSRASRKAPGVWW